MSDREIVDKAVDKAIENGWTASRKHNSFTMTKLVKDTKIVEFTNTYNMVFTLNDLIYDHDFAKALWGEKPYCRTEHIPVSPQCCWASNEMGSCGPVKAYESHLQQMVIAENPLEYLKDNM